MEYRLCNTSSEEEEGEIKATKFSLDTNFLYSSQFYHKNYFVGPNKRHLPTKLLFPAKSDEAIKNKLKKEPFFSKLFTFMNKFKAEVTNFTLIKKLTPKKEKIDFLSSTEEIKKLTKQELKHAEKFESTYYDDLQSILAIHSVHKNVIIITDRILAMLKKLKTPFKATSFKGRNILIFCDPFLKEANAPDLVQMYGKECLAQRVGSKEIRRFFCNDTEIVVLSYAVFMGDNKVMRGYKNLDSPKMFDVLVEEDSLFLVEDYEEIEDEADILVSIGSLKEGDYFYENNSVFICESLPSENQGIFNFASLFNK